MPRPQFTLRSLLAAMLLVAVVCAVPRAIVQYAEWSVRRQYEQWSRQRYGPPPGWELPPGYYIDDQEHVRRNNPHIFSM